MTATPEIQRDHLTWAGLAVVGVAAAVLSFTALRDLGELCSIGIPWLLPVVVDVFAATATRIWLRASAPPDAVRYARAAAWCAIATTVAGNAGHGWFVASAHPSIVPWWVAVAVASLPAVALGALVHLAVLVGRPVAEPEPGAAESSAELIRRPVGAGASDSVLVADLRDWAAESGLPAVDAVRLAYRVGTGRAQRLRELATAPTDVTPLFMPAPAISNGAKP